MNEKDERLPLTTFDAFMAAPIDGFVHTGTFDEVAAAIEQYEPRQLGYMTKPGYKPEPTVMLGDGRTLTGDEALRWIDENMGASPRHDDADSTD